MKILLCLQMWDGDIDDGEKLLRLLADLCPVPSETVYSAADLMIATRFDCRPVSTGLVQRLDGAFAKVWLRKSQRKEIGYPGGCNGLWFDSVQHVADMHRLKLMDYSAVLTTEADACPLVKDWDIILRNEWEKLRQGDPGLAVAGHWIPAHHELGHVNGNALFDSRVFDRHPKLLGCNAAYPWDVELAPVFKKLGWADTKKIRSSWKQGSMPEKEITAFKKSGVAWLHGVKDASVRDWARKNLIPA